MAQVIVAMATTIFTVVLVTALSLWANRHFAAQPYLPMQWGLDRSVTWSAPRKVALAFTPILAAMMLTFIAALTAFKTPRPGQEGLVAPITLLVGAFLIGFHALHLWMMHRTVHRQAKP